MSNLSRHLRDCFGCFTTGVTIATAFSAEGVLYGVTVNSFSSVSLDPALLLFSLDNNSSSIAAFLECRYFSLNILAEDQLHLSKRFSMPAPHNKWEGVHFSLGGKTQAPILDGVLAYLECEKEKTYEGGDHTIFVGKVLECNRVSEESPLIYYKGAYRSIGAKL